MTKGFAAGEGSHVVALADRNGKRSRQKRYATPRLVTETTPTLRPRNRGEYPS